MTLDQEKLDCKATNLYNQLGMAIMIISKYNFSRQVPNIVQEEMKGLSFNEALTVDCYSTKSSSLISSLGTFTNKLETGESS